MNERIRELALQAELNATLLFNKDKLEKFAELIVRECIQVCADRGAHHDYLYHAWAIDCSQRIGKHFGVE